ncbi:MAG: hypothetical protein ACD_70C00173G0001 [uncultured bacterium]|nr:MAG: hypothetical protein ACD_70C00173G0001 [uncultured bacterium]
MVASSVDDNLVFNFIWRSGGSVIYFVSFYFCNDYATRKCARALFGIYHRHSCAEHDCCELNYLGACRRVDWVESTRFTNCATHRTISRSISSEFIISGSSAGYRAFSIERQYLDITTHDFGNAMVCVV